MKHEIILPVVIVFEWNILILLCIMFTGGVLMHLQLRIQDKPC